MTTKVSALTTLLSVTSALILCLSQTVSAQANEPCQVTENDWGYWQVEEDCWWLNKPPQVLSLPSGPEFKPRSDLIPVDADIDIGGAGIFIEIKTQNNGHADSTDFEIEVVVVLIRGGKNGNPSARLTSRVQGLQAGDDRRDHIGIARLNYQDGDLVAISARVDIAGDNPEEDETNNLLIESCTIDLSNSLDPCDD